MQLSTVEMSKGTYLLSFGSLPSMSDGGLLLHILAFASVATATDSCRFKTPWPQLSGMIITSPIMQLKGETEGECEVGREEERELQESEEGEECVVEREEVRECEKEREKS